MKTIFNSKKGFTLIELLVVIGIVGILAGVLMANFVGVRQRSRDATRKSDLRQIQSALEFYRADIGSYPPLADITNFTVVNCGVPFTGGSPPNTYMTKVPCDPQNVDPYRYIYFTNVTFDNYTLIACLENTNDSQKDSSNNATYCDGGTTNWSFTLRNP